MNTVVIVDDEPITRMDLSDMLRELGFTVAGEAADGFDAIELCRSLRPDVVLMDVRMPVFDGLTATETILEEDLAGCVILLTAFSDREIIDRASRAGVTGYLVKPIDQKSLLPTIQVALAQIQRLRQCRQEAQAAQRRVREERQIHKAQQLLAQSQGCSEAEAYRRMRKTAMDKRVTVAALAQRILDQAARGSDVEPVKALLMARKNMTDQRAYLYITTYAKAHNLTTEQAAKALRAVLTKEESPC